jgi:hypothetical protein
MSVAVGLVMLAFAALSWPLTTLCQRWAGLDERGGES